MRNHCDPDIVLSGRRWGDVSRLLILTLCTLMTFPAFTYARESSLIQRPPKLVTSDSMFSAPYIDVDEWRNEPVRHRYVHGGFMGTEARFSFYFPPQKQYQGRFFQHITPVPDNENLAPFGKGEESKLGFAIASGAYFVETNGGGKAFYQDPTIAGYRVNAAAAQFSRSVAQAIYDEHRPLGYAYGGSGGSYRTIAGFENTDGVWDGVVPYVIGSPMSIPNVFTVRLHAMRILKNKFPAIVDAVDVGGHGDMYAGLSREEHEALEEVTRMGFPPSAWFSYEYMGQHAFPVLFNGVVQADPGYFKDFWQEPGYLGANPPESLRSARIQHTTTIKKVITTEDAAQLGLPIGRLPGQARGGVDTAFKVLERSAKQLPVGYQLASIPNGDIEGANLIVTSGEAVGESLLLREMIEDVVLLGPGHSEKLDDIRPGDKVRIDNSNFLAVQTYHRHQIPAADFAVWDQFKDDKGEPRYPQRPTLLGPLFSRGATGSVQTGKFKGKMIVVESLMDQEAYPWQADWYRSKVEAALGAELDDHFRLWFTEHALHGDFSEQKDSTRTVSYLGVLHQALRDLSAWVEKGTVPPSSTSYQVENGQVLVPLHAAERGGIQPVVTVAANGSQRAEVAVGESVSFKAVVEIPPNTGQIVAAAWDFEGEGRYPLKVDLNDIDMRRNRVTITSSYGFKKAGTYFPVLRVASHRQGDRNTPYARVQNLGRVRVVVNASVADRAALAQ